MHQSFAQDGGFECGLHEVPIEFPSGGNSCCDRVDLFTARTLKVVAVVTAILLDYLMEFLFQNVPRMPAPSRASMLVDLRILIRPTLASANAETLLVSLLEMSPCKPARVTPAACIM